MPAHVTASVIAPPTGRPPGLGAPAGEAPGDLFAMLMGMIDQGDAPGLEVPAQFAAVQPKSEPAVPRQGLPGAAADTAPPGPTDSEAPARETLGLDLAPAIPQAATASTITTGAAPTGAAPQSPPPSAPIQTAQTQLQTQTQPQGAAQAQAQANLAQQAQAREAATPERQREPGAQPSVAVPPTSDSGAAGRAGKPVESLPVVAETATSTPARANQAAAAPSPSPAPPAQAAPAPISLVAANPLFKPSDGAGAGAAPVEPDVSAPPPSIAAQAAAQASLGQPAAKTAAKPAAAPKTLGGAAAPAANPSGQSATPALARAAVPAAPAPAAFVGDGEAALDDAVVLARVDAADSEAVRDRDALRGASTQVAAGGTAPGAAPPGAAPATAGTVSHLAAQMLQRLDGRATRFDIQLDPAGLGRVNVQLNIDTRGRLTAALTFERPDSAEALKARSGELRQALEEAGFDLPEDSLSFRSDLDRRSTEDRRGEQQADAQGRGRAFDAAAETADQIDQGLSPAQRRRDARGLDIRI